MGTSTVNNRVFATLEIDQNRPQRTHFSCRLIHRYRCLIPRGFMLCEGHEVFANAMRVLLAVCAFEHNKEFRRDGLSSQISLDNIIQNRSSKMGDASSLEDSTASGDLRQLPEFLNRDLSWLEFNRRVLHEAVDQRTPLLERLMFLGIFTSNLDEFFMKRVGRLSRQKSLIQSPPHADGAPHVQWLTAIRETVMPMLETQAQCFRDDIRPALAEHGIQLLSWAEMTEQEHEIANRYFQRNVFPVMTPQAVDPSHPFPFISNLSDSLAIELCHPQNEERQFARVKVPQLLPAWIELDTGVKEKRFASLREIIVNNLGLLFPGMVIGDVLPMRVTRSAAVDADEENSVEDLLERVEEELRQRRLQKVVRLEHTPNPNRWLLDQVIKELELSSDLIFEMPGELDYTDFRSIAGLPVPELHDPTWTPQIPPALTRENADIFGQIRKGDILLHHPYESFDASVARFIHSAVNDEQVMAIKMTVYRTSDDTPFVPWLIQAAELGKQVACLVELTARFDEHRNIKWANALEDAGVHVVYGVMGVKTHTKTALVVRRESDGLRCYAHVGTGNYNPQTAKLYTDLGLLTCRSEITSDVVELFHYLTGRSLKRDYRKLLVAPVNMKERFLALIEREIKSKVAGKPARIVAKMNQLEDGDIMRALYRASQAGVPIDLIVRGFCCLRPGIPGRSESIRVISVIGRFLEHARIFYFAGGHDDPLDGDFYIGSADWMHRNLEERVEAVAPVEDHQHRERLWEILHASLDDQRQAWEMQPDGSYQQRTPSDATPREASLGTHRLLMEKTLKSAQ